MIEILAIILIAVGIFFVIRGLTEEYGLHKFGYENIEEKVRSSEREEEFKSKKKVKTGGVVLVGPIPIVFGDSKYAVYALILTIALMLSIFLIFLLYQT